MLPLLVIISIFDNFLCLIVVYCCLTSHVWRGLWPYTARRGFSLPLRFVFGGFLVASKLSVVPMIFFA